MTWIGIGRTIVAGLMCTMLCGQDARHVMVYREKGRFGGWPANHGIWSWGNEILVGFSAAWYKQRDPGVHQMDAERPEEPRLARSMDGGMTWKVETPRSLLPPAQGGKAARPLDRAMDFSKPGFAMTLRFTDVHTGPSLLFFSYDKGRNWEGPFEFPMFGLKGVAARTDYIVKSGKECVVFLTGAKENGREGRPFVARTTDGGLHWEFVGWIGPEPKVFAIMPSSLRLKDGGLLTAVRVKQDDDHNWIDAWRSDDEGKTWRLLGKVGDTGGKSGTAASLIRLRDGRLCLTYGSRTKPFPILARISGDEGKSWGEPIVLRADGVAWDVGYLRSAVRPDGKVVSVYYYNDAVMPERFVGATVWGAPGLGRR